MNSIIFVAFSIFVGAQSQVFAPYPRTVVPAMMPGCPCGNPAALPLMKSPCELPFPLPVPAAVPRPVAKAPCGCLEAYEAALPAGLPLANPFLPAASPISAMAPFSPLLPPANTCSRCQYLKKIPIPPPCI